MWNCRLKNKTSFSRACSKLVKDNKWFEFAKEGKNIHIEPILQLEILEGFKKFYDKESYKYQLICKANNVTWQLDASGKSGCFALIMDNGQIITISKKCQRMNKERDIKAACRGSIHREQILSIKKRNNTEVDHCNDGGFAKLYSDWRQENEHWDTNFIFSHIVKNDVLSIDAAKKGFCTFKEPVLSNWKEYHAKHSILQEISPEEHKKLTKKRRII